MFQDHYESQLNRFKESFLTEAAKCGRTEEVASLIELGARVDWSPQNEDTPLLIAVRNNHLDVATILIAHGADVERRGEGGNSALHLACYSGNEEMCALLLSSTSVSENNQACLAITSVNDGSNLSSEYKLNQNYPNPFNPSTIISYNIPKEGFVTLKVFNILGAEVATLINNNQNAGAYEITFDASNLTSGIYFYKIDAGGYSNVKKLILMK